MTRRPQPRTKDRETLIERFSGGTPIEHVVRARHYVDVFDTEGARVHEYCVPFGLEPTEVRFAVMMLERFHPDVRILETREAAEGRRAAILVADRGPE